MRTLASYMYSSKTVAALSPCFRSRDRMMGMPVPVEKT
jgi:hypothetical protein